MSDQRKSNSQLNLQTVPLKQLLAEIERRQRPVAIKKVWPLTEWPKKEKIVAGEGLTEGTLVVVNEKTRQAFAYPETPTISDEQRIWGYVIRDTKQGKRLRLKHWCFDDLLLG